MTPRSPFIIGLLLGGVASVTCYVLWNRLAETACDITTTSIRSPSGRFTATQKYQLCGGFGWNADRATLHIEKHSPNGWFQNLELELDPNSFQAPAMEWKQGDLLEIEIYSGAISGTVTRVEDGLRLVTTYVQK